MSSFLVELRAQIVQHAALVLTGQFDVDENLISPHSPLLLEHILAQNIPRGFLNELVFRLHAVDCETLSEVFLKINCYFQFMLKLLLAGFHPSFARTLWNDAVFVSCGKNILAASHCSCWAGWAAKHWWSPTNLCFNFPTGSKDLSLSKSSK